MLRPESCALFDSKCLSLPFCRAPPAAPPAKRRAPATTPTTSDVPSPSTPVSVVASEPDNQKPDNQKPEEEGKKRRRTAKTEEPLTPLAKGRDMASKLLKKKSDAANLGLSLQNVPYAEQLAKEMSGFTKEFESFSCMLGSVFCEVCAV